MNSTNVRHFLPVRRYFATKPVFERHYGDNAIIRGLEDGTIVRGLLSVSTFNNARAKVLTDTRQKIQCTGFVNRNRALSGDSVFAQIIEDDSKSESNTHDECRQTVSSEDALGILSHELDSMESKRTCRIVGIDRRADQRFVCRTRPNESLVQPRDPRFPAMRLAASPKVSETSLSLVKFTEWTEYDQYPLSSIMRLLGPEGSFSAEDDASLELAGLISEKYSPDIEASLRASFPDSKTIVERELKTRLDVRQSERVFTIDPQTARDLDDAISVTQVDGNLYRIGVHVADVSYFVRENSRVDAEAKDRATSVYLPRQVYPMLPQYLSEHLCSLLPNTDRLAFSVYFSLNSETGVMHGEPTFHRTIIRSVAKLSYEDVDSALAGNVGAFPSPLLKDITSLSLITRKLRENRIANGSVSIDDRNGIDLKFDFSPDHPVGILLSSSSPGFHDSHTLIEELMVLTNKLVANKLVDSSSTVFPVVRRHLDSETGVIEAARNFLRKTNVQFEPDSSLTQLLVDAKSQLSPLLYSAFTHSILGQFNRAEYIVPESEGAGTSHWGVGAGRYMHFTSPIRRYADLIVHRKMEAILLGKADNVNIVDQIKKCNTNARAAQEAESNNKLFYFTAFLRSFGNAGYPIDTVVKSLIVPVEAKSIKGSIVFYVPLIGDVRSQSMESLGLELVDSTSEENEVVAVNVRNRRGEIISIKLFEPIVMRAFVRKDQSTRFHLKMNQPQPSPPS